MMADAEGFPIIAPTPLDYPSSPPLAIAVGPSRLFRILTQVMHRLSAVAVLLLAGGLGVAYKERGTLGAGSSTLTIALLVAMTAALAGGWASYIGKRDGQPRRGAGLLVCIALIWVIAFALLADQMGWLQSVAETINEQFERLSTQELPRRRRPRS